MPRALITIFALSFIACGDSDGDSCVTRDDCAEGQVCVNGGCTLPSADAATTDVSNSDAAVADSAGSDAGPCDPGCGDLLCDPGTSTCVECLRGADCASAVCVNNACLECADSSECTEPSSAACSDEGLCVACTDNTECAGIVVDGVVLAACDAGTCVECTEATLDACGGNSCDPALGRCTDTPLSSLVVCDACVSDAECGVGSGCVPLEFADEPVGTYCLRNMVSGCLRGFRTLVNAESVSGVAGPWCSVSAGTTCEAVNAFAEPCVDTAECGLGGECRGMPALCTVPCASRIDCPQSMIFSSCDADGFCQTS